VTQTLRVTEADFAPIAAEMAAIFDLEHQIRVADRLRHMDAVKLLEAERLRRCFAPVRLNELTLVYPLNRNHFHAITNRLDLAVPSLYADYWDVMNHYAEGEPVVRLALFIRDRRGMWITLPADSTRSAETLDYFTVNPGPASGLGPAFIEAFYRETDEAC
jgi:hypothetical protein